MFRNAEEKDFALYMELAQEFYHSPAVMHPIPAQYMENTFREAMRSDVYIILRILEVDGEAAHWSATDVESWELVGPPATAEQHLIDTFAAANEFVATLADRLYHTIMPVTEESVITAYADDLTFWASHPDLGGVPCALWNIAALQAAEWARKETGIACELDVREPLV